MTKLKILFASEAHYLSSGFSKIYKELITRLYNTQKYDIAEFATYGVMRDGRTRQSPWPFYCNHLEESDPQFGELQRDTKNQFGKWRFEKVLLHFKPDVVIDIRDSFMYDFEVESGLRPFFHHILMPTCDSHPQKEIWIDYLIRTDAVFTYTKYAYDVIKREGGGKVNLIDYSTPCLNTDEYCPTYDKKTVRRSLGLDADGDILLVGSVMRNQKRKLIPDLMLSFRKFLNKCYERNNVGLARKSYLYLHTSYPDHGWKIPYFLMEQGLSNKVVFTYVCQKCRQVFASFFQGAKTICPKCKQPTATFPSVSVGCPEEHLIRIYQSFDFYVQLCNAGGLELPVMEASACGIPTACTNYSGPEDFVNFLGAIPIPTYKKFFDMENTAYRVYPSVDKCADIIYDMLSLPDQIRQKKGFEIRQKIMEDYTWDKFVQKWENYLDHLELTGLQGKWDYPSREFEPNLNVPEGLTNAQFVDWGCANIVGNPDLAHTYEGLNWTSLLNDGMVKEGPRKIVPIDRNLIIRKMLSYLEKRNYWDKVRTGQIKLPKEDFLEYAEMFEE